MSVASSCMLNHRVQFSTLLTFNIVVSKDRWFVVTALRKNCRMYSFLQSKFKGGIKLNYLSDLVSQNLQKKKLRKKAISYLFNRSASQLCFTL